MCQEEAETEKGPDTKSLKPFPQRLVVSLLGCGELPGPSHGQAICGRAEPGLAVGTGGTTGTPSRGCLRRSHTGCTGRGWEECRDCGAQMISPGFIIGPSHGFSALPGALLHQHGCSSISHSLRKNHRSQAPGRAKPGSHTMLQGQCGEDMLCCQQLVPQPLFSTLCKEGT